MAILKMYAPFFDGNNWLHVLTSGKDWMIILTLIIMECLLSVDNAVVLAAQTQVLPTKSEKEKSLLYGLWGILTSRKLSLANYKRHGGFMTSRHAGTRLKTWKAASFCANSL